MSRKPPPDLQPAPTAEEQHRNDMQVEEGAATTETAPSSDTAPSGNEGAAKAGTQAAVASPQAPTVADPAPADSGGGDIGTSNAGAGDPAQDAASPKAPPKASKPKAETPLAPPKLPPGTQLDLKSATISFGDVTFELDRDIPVPKEVGAVVHADQLTQRDWLRIAKRNELLWGIDLDAAARTAATGDRRAGRAGRVDRQALLWCVPKDDGFYSVASLSARSTSEVSYSAYEHNLVVNRIASGGGSVAMPFAAAAVKAEEFRRIAHKSRMRQTHLYGAWEEPRAIVYLGRCTVAHPEFVKEIRAALDRGNDADRIAALKAVFEAFGQAAPRRLTLGGVSYHSREETVSSEVSETTIRQTIEAGVDARKDGATASADIAFKNGQGESVSAQTFSGSSSWEAFGGDTSLLSEKSLGPWLQSVKDPNNWAVMSFDDMAPLVDWLDADLRARFWKVWNRWARPLWNGHDTPKGFLLPEGLDRPLVISADSDDNARSVSSEEGETIFDNDSSEMLRTMRIKPGGAFDAAAKETLWRLIYSGRTGSGDLPLYWIVEEAPDEALKPIREGNWADLFQPVILLASQWKGTDVMSLGYPDEAHYFEGGLFSDLLTWLVLPIERSVEPGQASRPYRLIPAVTARASGFLDSGMGFSGFKALDTEVLSCSEDSKLYLRIPGE